LQHIHHEPFRFEDFVTSITIVDHEYDFFDGWTGDFFVFGCDEDCCCADELEFVYGDVAESEETVYYVYGEEEGFGEEVETGMDLD
jgi:hypothetical protein